MHKLERDPVPPACLVRYRHGRDQWSAQSPNAEERAQIWEKLDAMQGSRCAYCESALTERKRKIEHFRQRDSNRYPQGTFEWSNLFGACIHSGHCDSSKDTYGEYDYRLLIKPDDEDPELFLVFNPSGEVRPRESLSGAEFRRAQSTIDILKLNERSLVARRRKVLLEHAPTATDFASVALGTDDPAILAMVDEAVQIELQRVVQLPYATAIRHLLAG